MERRVAYGEGEDEVVDLFLPPQTQQPKAVVVYIHGGMWQFLRSV
jgi:acetyl esterase/lipase